VSKRDLVSFKRDLVSVKRDLVSVKRDLASVKRDLASVKRDLSPSLTLALTASTHTYIKTHMHIYIHTHICVLFFQRKVNKKQGRVLIGEARKKKKKTGTCVDRRGAQEGGLCVRTVRL
jgi:hypothetical protein